jgi:hypothetical protein
MRSILDEYMEKYSVKSLINPFKEKRYAKANQHGMRLLFSNGYGASIVYENTKIATHILNIKSVKTYPIEVTEDHKTYSVALYDHNGFVLTEKFKQLGFEDGFAECNTELEVIVVCELIRNLPDNDCVSSDDDE